MKELKVGDSFLWEEELFEVKRVWEDVYYAYGMTSGAYSSFPKDLDLFKSSQIKHIHTMRVYQGFTDTYNYCTECNYKDIK